MDCTYDRTLLEIGNEHKYQKRFDIVYICIFFGLWSMTFMNMFLALAITPHTCKIPEKPSNISKEEWKIFNIPRNEDTRGELKFENCLVYTNPYENNNSKACQEYIYDNTWYDKTVPSEYNWVCDKEIRVANILAYGKVAEIVGSVFFGWFGDVYGRRYTYIVSLTMLLLGRIISLLSGMSYYVFLIGCVLSNFPSWSAPQTLTIISVEMSSARRRTATATKRFTSFAIGLFFMSLLFWWLRDWKIFVIVTTAPLIPYLIMSWKLSESPQWLYTQGRVQSSLKQLKKIAKVNKKELQPNTEKDILSANSIDRPQVYGVLTLFSEKRLAINTIIQIVVWIVDVINILELIPVAFEASVSKPGVRFLLVLSGFDRIVTSLGYSLLIMGAGEKSDGNPFLDFAWQALSEVPAAYLAAWLADTIGRRYTGVTAFAISSVMWANIALRENSVSSWIRKWWIGTLFNVLVRLSTTMSLFIISLLTTELYPTCLRQTGSSLGNIVSGLASAVCPYILLLGRQIDPRIPPIILVAASAVGIISSLLLPETLNTKLPETLEEAQVFGCKDKKNNLAQLQPLTTFQNI